MATTVVMPKVGISVESCILTKWFKGVGDKIAIGDLLFTYETDKVSTDEFSTVEGVLLQIVVQEGDEAPILSPVGVIGSAGEQVYEKVPTVTEKTTSSEKVISKSDIKVVTCPKQSEIKASPRARARAKQERIDLSTLTGSGPEGRIVEQDVIKAKKAIKSDDYKSTESVVESSGQKPSAVIEENDKIIKLSATRLAIAKAMTNSLAQTAQLTNHSSFDAGNILEYRKVLKEQKDETLNGITVNDILLYTVAKTLKLYPEINAHLTDNQLHCYAAVNLGVAVDTPRGLLVPVLKNADKMSLAELSKQTKELIELTQAGKLTAEELSGATFTVTNLGALGVESFTPIINPPEVAILGICSINERIKTAAGKIQVYSAMGLSFTYDHRAIDGAPAARFIQTLKENLERFTSFLAK